MANQEMLAAGGASAAGLVKVAIDQLREAFRISPSITDEQIAIRHDALIAAMVEASAQIYLANQVADGAGYLGAQIVNAAAVS